MNPFWKSSVDAITLTHELAHSIHQQRGFVPEVSLISPYQGDFSEGVAELLKNDSRSFLRDQGLIGRTDYLTDKFLEVFEFNQRRVSKWMRKNNLALRDVLDNPKELAVRYEHDKG